MPINLVMKGLPKGVPVGGGFAFQSNGEITATDIEGLAYDVWLEVELVDGRYVCTQLKCTRREGGEPVTTNGLRAIPLGRIVALAFEPTVMKYRTNPHAEGEVVGEPVGEGSDDAVKVAAIYRLAYACGLNPTAEVASALRVSKSVASNRVMAARRAGLLDPTEKGKAKAGGRS